MIIVQSCVRLLNDQRVIMHSACTVFSPCSHRVRTLFAPPFAPPFAPRSCRRSLTTAPGRWACVSSSTTRRWRRRRRSSTCARCAADTSWSPAPTASCPPPSSRTRRPTSCWGSSARSRISPRECHRRRRRRRRRRRYNGCCLAVLTCQWVCGEWEQRLREPSGPNRKPSLRTLTDC